MESFGAEDSWSLLNAAPDGVVVASATGEIVFVSDQAATLLRYEPADLIGQSVDVLLPEAVRAVHRAHRTRYRAEPQPRAMGAGLLLRARRSDASEFPVEISLKPLLRDGELFVVAAVRDVTDRVATEEHLHRVLLTLDASDDGVFIFDAATLQYSYVNEGAVRLVGYHRDELMTMTPLHLNPDDSELEYRAFIESVESSPDQAMVRQARLLRKDGTEIPVEKTYRSVQIGDGGSRWIIALARDITTRLATEVELQRSHEALHAAERVVAIADDRERIARDLHDKVIQRLFAAGLNIQAVVSAADDRIRPRLESTIDALDDTIRELRMAIFSLQGSGSAPGGLRGQILDVVSDAVPGLGFEPRLQFDGPVESISDDIAAQLVPTLREALSNVARHAGAHSVQIYVSATDPVTLEVIDDGVGLTEDSGGTGHGLVNLASRARELGGTFDIVSEHTGGVRLRWSVPTGMTRSDVGVRAPNPAR
ncbi:MAG TPA: PAS domain S-box protein [Ilumatobacteraceae bacterium]|nr:PAS domain S-box protein [Ilumatobacteraceae bacterium]